MWVSYEALCEMGAVNIDPTTVFGVRPAEIDRLQERFQQQNLTHDEAPLQEKSVLTPHHFTPPTHGAGLGGAASSRPMDLGTPAASIGPKASLFQTAQKPAATTEPGSTAILPNHLQFDTPNLTPIPMQQDASFIHQQRSHLAGVTFQQSSMMSEADIPLNHVFGDTFNPHTVRRAKHIAARLYYQPSPETRSHGGIPTSGRVQNTGLETSREIPTRRFLRGKSALNSAAHSKVDFEPTISETPVRRGGRPSDISTARRPRALFLSENKAMRENTNDLNQTSSSVLEDNDGENDFHRGGEGVDLCMDDENHPDDDQPSSMLAEDNATGTHGGHQSSFVTEEEKPYPFAVNLVGTEGELDDEDAIIERHGAVQRILELLCLLGAGYWRLCQVSSIFDCVRTVRSISSYHLLSFFSFDAARRCSYSEPSHKSIAIRDGFFTKKVVPILKWQITKTHSVVWK
jgi:hypothetical protein